MLDILLLPVFILALGWWGLIPWLLVVVFV
jgi:hypothetical protein